MLRQRIFLLVGVCFGAALFFVILFFPARALQETMKTFTDDLTGNSIEESTGYYDPLLKSIVLKRRINETILWQTSADVRYFDPYERIALTKDNKFFSIPENFSGYEDLTSFITLTLRNVTGAYRMGNEILIADTINVQRLSNASGTMRSYGYLNLDSIDPSRVDGISFACASTYSVCLFLSRSHQGNLAEYRNSVFSMINLSSEIDLSSASLFKRGDRLYIAGTKTTNNTIVFKLFYYDTAARKISIDGPIFTFSRLDAWTFGVKGSEGLLFVRSGGERKLLRYDGAGGWTTIHEPLLETIDIDGINSLNGKWLINRQDGLYLYESYTSLHNIKPQLIKINGKSFGVTDYNNKPLLVTDREAVSLEEGGYMDNAIIKSKKIEEQEAIVGAMVFWEDEKESTSITYYISNDDGKTWISVPSEKGARINFPIEGYQLRYRALLTGQSQTTPKFKKMVITYFTKDISLKGKRARDKTRADDLAKAAQALEKYIIDFQRFPRVDFSEAREGWQELKRILQSAGTARNKNYVGDFALPQDSAYPYSYRSSYNEYVLSTTFEEDNSTYLNNDADGTQLDFNCNDPVYCLTRTLYNTSSQINISPSSSVSTASSSPSSFVQPSSSPVIVPLPTSSPVVQPSSSPIVRSSLTKPALLKSRASPKVYRDIGKNQIIVIRSKELFESFGYSWQDIKVVSANEFKKYHLARLVKIKGASAIYLLNENGYKRKIATPAIFGSYGKKLSDVPEVEQEFLDFFSASNTIRLKGDKRVFIIIDNSKHWIKAPVAFNTLGLKWEQVIEVTKKDFDSYATGESIVY